MKPTLKGTDLRPRDNRWLYRVLYAGFTGIGLVALVLFVYGYAWHAVTANVKRSLAKDFFIEKTDRACTANEECVSACGPLDERDACLCLSARCALIENAIHFSHSRYCESDAECLISCFEGPVSATYYAAAGGDMKDCTEGCRLLLADSSRPDSVVCRNWQCTYESGRSCFLGSMSR